MKWLILCCVSLLLPAIVFSQIGFRTINSFEPKARLSSTAILDLTPKWKRNSAGNPTDWSCQGPWVLRNGEKFFAIGIWNIPGYTWKRNDRNNPPDTDANNIAAFTKATELFNLIYMNRIDYLQTYIKPLLSDTSNVALLMSGSRFKWRFQSEPNGSGYNVFEGDDEPIKEVVL